MLVRPEFEPTASRSADRRSPNWANRAAVTHRGGGNRKVCLITLQFNVVCICLQRIDLTARRVQPKQYHFGNLACVASVSNRIIARKLERGQGGYSKAPVCARSGSIRKNNSYLKRTTTVTYNKFFSLDIRKSNKVIFSCFFTQFQRRLTKTFMQTLLNRFWS